jgi:FMN phosphatase YigB (HAD superfamily)
MSKVIIFDFDGTITDSHYPYMGMPQPGVKETLQELRDMGFEIHILSCRTNKEINETFNNRLEQVRLMKMFLDKFEIPYDEILNEYKPVAHIYVDDRGVGHRGDWVETLKQIKSMQ